MAKKKANRVTATSAQNNSIIAQLQIKGGDGLPDYNRYYTCNHFRFFFEYVRSESDVLTDKINIGTRDSTYKILSDGKKIVGIEIAKTFCRLIIQYFNTNKPVSAKSFNSTCESLFNYIAQNETGAATFEDISFSTYVNFVLSAPNDVSAYTRKQFLKKLLVFHPHSKTFNFSSVTYASRESQPIESVDFDSLVDEKDYSDRVMMQILTYVFYELEVWKKRYEQMLKVSEQSLGENYVSSYSAKNHVLRRLLTSGKDGHDKLFLNYLLQVKAQRAGIEITRHSIQTHKIRKVVSTDSYRDVGGLELFEKYSNYLHRKLWAYYLNAEKPNYHNYLYFKTDHLAITLALYLMISTGKNQESILSIKRNYNGQAWFKNFDVNLGIDEDTPTAQKEIRVVGYKSRGVTGKKPIPIRIPINSPIFEYMKLYDDIVNEPDRENFFSCNINGLTKFYDKFCASFEILGDDDQPLITIQTTRLRKTFAGHLLMQLVEDVESSNDLVSKMRTALNHQKFDTTLFSYILKTGMGNQVINTAIVALTTDMLQKAMKFQGTIREDQERSAKNKEVYLCDCTDNSKPTHNLPIADKCKKYDMCLGCERAEVYALHLPNICYRVMQLEKVATESPLTFSGLLEDRRQIALDTINKFSSQHSRGVEIVEHAYFEASKAMKDGRPLLPPIIQFQ
ncbi:hypothetical protein [Pseudoalteromonas sp. DL-6]|uniref:hypothetical protein n=1 Tax=Pseudoalteromonas sp. DL-6 TaxID=1390185 RepID=UPI00103BAF49|nr:hypothetical protein [Pseudoalteromonas sp. DL-6]QBJ61643.1 hypothetical protein B1F84_00650 [Pseudoalteromonas sp. DL-6]